MQEDLNILKAYIDSADDVEVILSSVEDEQFFMNFIKKKYKNITLYLKDSRCLTKIVWDLYKFYDGEKVSLKIYILDLDLSKVDWKYLTFLRFKFRF
jgi:hypothetical protein